MPHLTFCAISKKLSVVPIDKDRKMVYLSYQKEVQLCRDIV
jgi:hypothetical protein